VEEFQLMALLRDQPKNPELWEKLADALSAQDHEDRTAEAAEVQSYAKSLRDQQSEL
jgi:hypothetical protein